MIEHEILLVTLVQLVGRIPLPSPPAMRGRGRPPTYPNRLFLQALLIMIVRHVHTVHTLLSVLAHQYQDILYNRCALKPTLSRSHDLEEEQLRCSGEMGCSTPGWLRPIDDDSVLGRQWQQGALHGRKACGIKHSLSDVFHFVVPSIVPAAILGEYDVLKHRSQLLAGHPQQHLCARESLLHLL